MIFPIELIVFVIQQQQQQQQQQQRQNIVFEFESHSIDTCGECLISL